MTLVADKIIEKEDKVEMRGRILFTGSGGFLGTYFRHFTQLECDRIIFGSSSNLKVPEGEPCDWRQFSSCYTNIEEIVGSEKIDVIVHAASVIPKSFSDATCDREFRLNTAMIQSLGEFACAHGVKRFVYISSFGSMEDTQCLDIKDYYTLSKVTGELFCRLFSSKGVSSISLRISAPYGEFQGARTVMRVFIERALAGDSIEVFGTGAREQNFTYAGDVAKAIELALDNTASGTYEIVGEKSYSMLELAQLIKQLTGSTSEIVVGNQPDPQEHYRPHYRYDRALKDFGYRPTFDLPNGLQRFISWLKGNPVDGALK